MYNPPSKPHRPFDADYPNGALDDGAGHLTRDIEGSPLVPGSLIVGRRVVGEADRSLTAPELQSVAEAGTGRPVQITAPGAGVLGRNDLGAVESVRSTNIPRQV